MIFYCFMMICITLIIDCADFNKSKKSESVSRIQESILQSQKLQNREEISRIQNKKKAEKADMKNSLKSLTGSPESIEDNLDRIITQ